MKWLYSFLLLIFIEFVITNCETRIWDNPFDTTMATSRFAPSNLTAEQINQSSIQLTWWTNYYHIDGFYVERKCDSSSWITVSNNIPIIHDINYTGARGWVDSLFEPDKEYSYRVYAKAGNNISDYSNVASIITQATLPTITTVSVADISTTSVVCKCTLNSNGGSDIIRKGVCWGESPEPIWNDNSMESKIINNTFTLTVTDLKPNTAYYFRAYVENNVGLQYGNTIYLKLENLTLDIQKTSESLISKTVFTNNKNLVITEKGICWSTINPIPTLVDNKIQANGDPKLFTNDLSNLIQSSKCYVRSYVKTDTVTYFSTEKSFTPNEVFVDTRDNKTYLAVKIGAQTWMSENLAFIPIYDKYYINKDPDIFGYLYPWGTANDGSCPLGWHLPSESDWNILIEFLGGNAKAGYMIKSNSYWPYDINNSNESGFNALSAGVFEYNWQLFMDGALFWSSTINLVGNVNYYVSFTFNSENAFVESMDSYSGVTGNGLSIRCVKD